MEDWRSDPVRFGLHGLAMLWDRRAEESADGAAAEAYQRAAAEVQEVLRVLSPPPRPHPVLASAVQPELEL